MKLLLMIFILLAMLLGFIYLLSKMGIDVNKYIGIIVNSTPSQEVQRVIVDGNGLYQQYSSDYEHVGDGVWDCFVSLQTKYALDCTGDKRKIFAANIADRVKVQGNKYIFTYEIKVNRRSYIKEGTLFTEKIDKNAIADAINRNLPVYMHGGYYYSGNVYVWECEKSIISVEISGVDRKINQTNERVEI